MKESNQNNMRKSQTLTTAIACAPKKVYAFVSNPENMPKWAKTFCRSIRKSADDK